MIPLLLSIVGALDLPIIVAGHQYDFGSSPPGEPGDDDGGGGIGMASIVAVLFLTLVTVGVLAWLNRREQGSSAENRVRALKMKSIAPLALTVVLIATPLALWTASSGDEDETLIVERATGVTGSPEFIVYLEDDDLNTLKTTHGKRTVRVECLGREGQVVLDSKQRWPFTNNEPGFDSPHIHQAASREQLQQADRCRLRGTRVRVEADVEGGLAG
jgi:hypothetical protein